MRSCETVRSVAILEAGPLNPALAARYGSHGAFFQAYLAPRAPGVDFPIYSVYREVFPASAAAHDAYLVTGSSYSVYEPLAWIERLKAFVREAAASRPVVGICFGHQLIAEAFGGRVEKARQGWGIGVHRYQLTATAGWMAPARREVALIASHQDQVVEPPPGAEVLAGSAFCPVAMLQLGRNVMSIQAHPEARVDYSRELYETRRERIGATQVDTAVASLSEPTDGEAVAGWILTFLGAQSEVGAAPA